MGNDTPSWGIYVGSKFENFTFFPPLRRIFGQARSTIDFRKVMDERKVLLVNRRREISPRSTRASSA